MMRWFDKWFQKQAKKAWEAEQKAQHNLIYTDSNPRSLSSSKIDANGINMKLHIANGGYIVEFHRYDDHKDRPFNELHVINDGEDLGQRLSEVIVQYIISNR
jgi:hypothetical protein